jgi:hypothetical protein
VSFLGLAPLAGPTADPVAFRVAYDQVIAKWSDRGVPQEMTMEPVPCDQSPPALIDLATLAPNPGLIQALRDACLTADRESSRFAIGCVQLRPTGGRMAATDSRQLLVQDGFELPWKGDRLMRSSDVFDSAELRRIEEEAIGEQDGWIVVQAGPWTIRHRVETEGRFPEIDMVLPNDSAVISWLELDPTDREFLAERIDRLPVSDPCNEPVTIDLNGSVAIRSQGASGTALTELVLSRSVRRGEELRTQTGRRYLARAVQLGLCEIGFTSEDGPILARDERRRYLWMSLGAEGALGPDPSAERIESPPGTSRRRGRSRRRQAA